MERSASVANIKCGGVKTYLPSYTANYLVIGRFAPLFHARGFASGIFIYLFSLLFLRSYTIVYSTSNLCSYIAQLTYIVYRQGYALRRTVSAI
jgi:hypothetical protein